jgi:hypothetical protein
MARRFDPNRKVMGSGQRRRASRTEPWTLEAGKTTVKGDVASIQSLLMAIQEEGDIEAPSRYRGQSRCGHPRV